MGHYKDGVLFVLLCRPASLQLEVIYTTVHRYGLMEALGMT